MKTVVLVYFLIYLQVLSSGFAQNGTPNSTTGHNNYNKALVRQLDSIFTDDQAQRQQMHRIWEQHGYDSKEMKRLIDMMKVTDSVNLIKVKNILDNYGWLGSDRIGGAGNQTLFLVIQHADPKTQEKYLPMMKDAVKQGRAESSQLALLIDRVEMNNGRPQVYGSQINGDTIYKILDEVNVNKRRAEVGLEPLEEYAKQFNIDYKPLTK